MRVGVRVRVGTPSRTFHDNASLVARVVIVRVLPSAARGAATGVDKIATVTEATVAI